MDNSESTVSSKNSYAMAGFDDIQEELTVVLMRLFDIMYPVAVFFGGIALAASMYRSLQ